MTDFDSSVGFGARQKVRGLLRAGHSKKMYTIMQTARYDNAIQNLAKVGLTPVSKREISLPMYSPNVRTYLLMVELTYSDDE